MCKTQEQRGRVGESKNEGSGKRGKADWLAMKLKQGVRDKMRGGAYLVVAGMLMLAGMPVGKVMATEYTYNQMGDFMITNIDIKNNRVAFIYEESMPDGLTPYSLDIFWKDDLTDEWLEAQTGQIGVGVAEVYRSTEDSSTWVGLQQGREIYVDSNADLQFNQSKTLAYVLTLYDPAGSDRRDYVWGKVDFSACARAVEFDVETMTCRAEHWPEDGLLHYHPYQGWNRVSTAEDALTLGAGQMAWVIKTVEVFKVTEIPRWIEVEVPTEVEMDVLKNTIRSVLSEMETGVISWQSKMELLEMLEGALDERGQGVTLEEFKEVLTEVIGEMDASAISEDSILEMTEALKRTLTELLGNEAGEVIREVVKEVPVEKIATVEKEVPVEKIVTVEKEVPVLDAVSADEVTKTITEAVAGLDLEAPGVNLEELTEVISKAITGAMPGVDAREVAKTVAEEIAEKFAGAESKASEDASEAGKISSESIAEKVAGKVSSVLSGALEGAVQSVNGAAEGVARSANLLKQNSRVTIIETVREVPAESASSGGADAADAADAAGLVRLDKDDIATVVKEVLDQMGALEPEVPVLGTDENRREWVMPLFTGAIGATVMWWGAEFVQRLFRDNNKRKEMKK